MTAAKRQKCFSAHCASSFASTVIKLEKNVLFVNRLTRLLAVVSHTYLLFVCIYYFRSISVKWLLLYVCVYMLLVFFLLSAPNVLNFQSIREHCSAAVGCFLWRVFFSLFIFLYTGAIHVLFVMYMAFFSLLFSFYHIDGISFSVGLISISMFILAPYVSLC